MTKKVSILSYVAFIPMALPIIFAFLANNIYELKLFLLANTNAKQQRLILEIFEQQNDGVLVLNQEESTDQLITDSVLLQNHVIQKLI
jgi:hypothetical protein